MNNLFSSSFAKYRAGSDLPAAGDVELGLSGGANLDHFFASVEALKAELKELEDLHRRLIEANESSKTTHQSSAVKALRARMDSDVSSALKKAKQIKTKLEALDQANAHNRSVPGCGPGSSTDRTRTSVVATLRSKLKDIMDSFIALRQRISSDYRDAVGRRYFTVTGQQPADDVLDDLIASGDAEQLLQRAIQQQGGRGEVVDVVTEIRERHGAAKDLERSLLELQQVFLDMSVLVTAQGEQLNDIESHVTRASSFVRGGTERLHEARVYQKNTRKWTCIAILILIVIILVIVVPIVVNNSKKK